MAGKSKAGKGAKRGIVDDFAAGIARKLNAGRNGVVEVEPGALLVSILDELGGKGPQGKLLQSRLLATALSAADRAPEELAQAYFDRVLDRRLLLGAGETEHLGHRLLGLLCRRGSAPGWSAAAVARAKGHSEASSRLEEPRDFLVTAQELKKHARGTSKGSAAPKVLAVQGPLWLTVGAPHRTEVAEEISIWQAITASPRRQRVSDVEEFDQLCSLMINAVGTANVLYGALVRLGLPPLDWWEAMTINTAKSASKFKTAVLALSDRMDHRPAWEDAWTKVKVPGFDSLEEFWNSELGRALRMPQIARSQTLPPGDDTADLPDTTGIDAHATLLDDMSFDGMLGEAEAEGALDAFERWLLGQLKLGQERQSLAREPRVREALSTKDMTMEDLIDDLRDRMCDWAREHLDAS